MVAGRNEQLSQDGWMQVSMGCGTSGANLDTQFALYIRRRKLAELAARKNDDNSKLSSSSASAGGAKSVENTEISAIDGMVSNPNMGVQKEYLTPPALLPVLAGQENLPVLSGFGAYPSIAAARTGRDALVIAMDSEWYNTDRDSAKPRNMLSWQFAVICSDELIEFVFLRSGKKNLSLGLALGRILDELPIAATDARSMRKYTALGEVDPKTGKRREHTYNTPGEAREHSACAYEDGKRYHIMQVWPKNKIPIVLLCHAGKADLTTLDQRGKYNKDILRYCTEVQGGLVTLQPIRLKINSCDSKYKNNVHKYPISLRIADTMCHTPAGMKRLEQLGAVVGWKKVDLPDKTKARMDDLLRVDPKKYFDYASNDSVVTLLYAAAIYGYNKALPVTITSASACVIHDSMAAYFGTNTPQEFDRKYRGLMQVKHGLVPREDLNGYVPNDSLEAISNAALTVQQFAALAYHGGYNSCSDIGYFPEKTWDYDLQNAYPTAMCLVPDIDWENPIKVEIINRTLDLNDFRLPYGGGYDMLSPMLAYVRFEFPAGVKYPCIPVNVDGIPIYPRTSDGLNGVYACGPELYLALRLGAKVFVERGYVLNCLYDKSTGATSYALSAAIKQLVMDRNRAKAEYGKKSLEDLILKTMVNSGYGKVGQNVIDKRSWSAYSQKMESLGCSSITNPVSACMITSIVRAELLAAQNQCYKLGYMSCSVTTDGFISDMPEEVLKSLDLYGIRRYMEKARLFLTDHNPEIWEAKHWQDDLVNFSTRGNVSLAPHGVCAHNGAKSGFEKDSFEDRRWLLLQVVSRNGAVPYTVNEWSKFKDLAIGAEFQITPVTRSIRMDYDMKRKPDRDSFYSKFVLVDGEKYEIACFTTAPFDNVQEFLKFRACKENCRCLRTMADWERFWQSEKLGGSKLKVRDKEWAVLNSCIIGHRAGFWTIPAVETLRGQARTDWINAHNTSTKRWKETDWKNAGRNSRQCDMLPQELLLEKLTELMEDR